MHVIVHETSETILPFLSLSPQVGPSTHQIREGGHEGAHRPCYGPPGAAHVPTVLPRPVRGDCPPVHPAGPGGGGEEGEHGTGPGVPHVLQIRASRGSGEHSVIMDFVIFSFSSLCVYIVCTWYTAYILQYISVPFIIS